ncbi:hypothetical protein ACVUNZ_000226 [Klebsiella pneumoniae]|uniref:hypothetical protein n=1 Tax=Raoultella ornithinolytica TaxID=54291 RepID=UPI001F3AFCE4|nr:hypothetical protein [Raoultella ornithinolytica]UIZ75655.1 hypothetical protein HRV96_21330 [Raoultella ornithinolytica]
MSNLQETPVWVDVIYQLTEETPVLGKQEDVPGDGPANIQAQQLANRTQYLKAMTESIADGKEYTFYKSASDPDGTIAGIQGTDSGKVFRVAQGSGDILAFRYFLNNSGVALEVAELIGQGSISNSIRTYSTLSIAQNDAVVGNIPDGAKCWVTNSSDGTLADEYINNAGTLTANGRRMPSQVSVDGKSITSGDVFSVLAPRASGVNGGSVIRDSGNRPVGLLVPAGSTGATSYFCSDIPASSLRGRTVRIKQVYTATSNWLPTVNLNALRAQSRAGGTVTTLTVTDYAVIQTGTTITQTGTVVVPADADYIGLAVQYASNATAKSADLSIQLTQAAYQIIPAAGDIATQNDAMLDQRLLSVNASVAGAQITANSALLTPGNIWGIDVGAKGSGTALNGAALITDSTGGVIGLNIPGNAGTGQSSYVTSWFSAEGLSGKTIDIIAVFTTSAAWSTDPAPNSLALQVLRSTGQVNVSVGSGATRTISQNGTTMTIAVQYTVDPTDVNIGVCYQIAGGNATREYARSMQAQSITYSIVPESGRTRNDAMLAVLIRAAIAAGLGDSQKITVTVKPTGGDYTHPKLALDHITDASITKKYVVAVYPGEYTGYAEWATKDYVDIIGIGRKEEIIVSYDSGDDADQATVRGTSLLWMASETLLKNLTLKIKNGRYCIHMESNGARPDITLAIEDCSIIHEGNASNTYWWQPSQYGVGAGLSEGNTVRLRNSYFEGRGGGFSFHTPNNRVDYTNPITVDAEGCTFKNTRTLTNTGYPYEGAFSIKPICIGAADTCRLVGNTFINGQVYYSTGEWLDTADTTTNRAQVQVWGHGNEGFSFYSDVPYTPNMMDG